jgi:hypothetical protein
MMVAGGAYLVCAAAKTKTEYGTTLTRTESGIDLYGGGRWNGSGCKHDGN